MALHRRLCDPELVGNLRTRVYRSVLIPGLEIADELGITEATVKCHVSEILQQA